MWDDTDEIGLKELRYEGVEWIHLVQDRVQWWELVNIATTIQVP
jgi:hypothetical protein